MTGQMEGEAGHQNAETATTDQLRPRGVTVASQGEGLRVRRGLSSLLTRLDAVRLEYLYLVLALVWGIALVVVMPPLQVPDEPAHFYRAWGLAEGALLPPRDFEEDLPANVWSLLEAFPVGPIANGGHYPAHVGPGVQRLLAERISPIRVAKVTSVPSQNPVAYVPQALGIEIARVTDSSPLGALYLARLVNLLAAITLVFFAIRLAPLGKAIILVVALFPTVISEMASVSPDALMIAGAMFFTGLVLNYSERATLGSRSMLVLLAVACVFLTVKPGYFPMVALVFTLSPQCCSSRKRYAAWLGGIIGAVLAVSALLILATPKAPASAGWPGADMMPQLEYVLRDPLGFTAVLLHTFSAWGLEYARQMVGVLGWLSISVSPTALFLLLAVVMILMSGFAWEPSLGARRRATLLTTWAATMVCALLGVYGGVNPVGAPIIDHAQGRYFAPVLPLLLIGLSRLQFRRRSAVVIFLLAVFALVTLTTMRAVWFHYH
jgi:uncharacterized membrane protein